MSISSMTNVAFVRRTAASEEVSTVPPQDSLGHPSVAPASRDRPVQDAKSLEQASAGTASSQSASTASLKAIATYIPTEILTLYVAVVAVKDPVKDAGAVPLTAWLTFWLFLIATPAVVWMVFATKIKAAGGTLPTPLRTWPIWEMTAATIAFFVWAFALPSTPFIAWKDVYSPSVAGLMVTVVTAVLGMLGPLMSKPLPSK